jgi:enamine deaminase RidA (YjgF/YER057c/UK114 family)
MATIIKSAGSKLLPLKRLLGHGHEAFGPPPVSSVLGQSHEEIGSEEGHTLVDLDDYHRIALAIAPKGRGTFIDQAKEVLEIIDSVLERESMPMDLTFQSVFVRRESDVPLCRQLFVDHFGDKVPATNYVIQPPCCGADLAIEAWAVGGSGAEVTFHSEHLVCVRYDGLRWVYCAGIMPSTGAASAYDQSDSVFRQMSAHLASVGATFDQVVRKWIYFGGITADEAGTERYRELNRARTDFFSDLQFGGNLTLPGYRGDFYPASTGIGTLGRGLVTSCQALQTDRQDVHLLPLENPHQTPSYDYDQSYSLKSPKFSRAMALITGDYVTTWISGTASIVDSETVYKGDIAGQTRQTIDNIRDLMAPANFARQGMPGCCSTLEDLAKVRVYIKHQEDYEKCRAICDERLGGLPTIYAVADVCRPDLLVEIEGVAFSSRMAC